MQSGQKSLNINSITISDRAGMPKYEECMQIINPQGLPLGALSYTEKLFLEFCQYWDSFPQTLKEAVRKW